MRRRPLAQLLVLFLLSVQLSSAQIPVDQVAPPEMSPDHLHPVADVDLLERWRQRLEEYVPERGWAGRWRLTDLTGEKGPRPYSRWSFSAAPWEASLVTERDPGERQWNDHLVGYLQWQSRTRQLVVGDLRPGFAQGLLFGRGSGRGRGRAHREATAIGTRSSAESRSIRGVVLRQKGAHWSWVALIAGLRWDARFDSTGAVRSLPVSGLHVGPTAVTGRRRLPGLVVGGRLRRQLGRLTIGVSFQQLWFGRRLILPSRYGRVLFSGRAQGAGELDLIWASGTTRVYMDLVRTPAAWAGLAGVSGVGPARLRLSVQARSYGAGFFSPLGAAGHRWQVANERGVVLGIRGRGWRGWIDASVRPEPWSIPVQDVSSETGLMVTWRPAQGRIQFTVRQRHDLDWRQRPRWRVARLGRVLGSLSRDGERTSQRVRLQIHHSRVGPDRGLAMGVDGQWKGGGSQGDLQWTLYRIASWAARLYEYEPGLPGTVMIMPLQGDGWRFNGALRHRFGAWMVSLVVRHERRRAMPPRSRFGLQVDRLSAAVQRR